MVSFEDKGLVPPGASPAGTPESAPTLPRDVLERAADLISKPGAWTQGAYARDALGHAVTNIYEIPPDAECFCLMGAVAVASGNAGKSFGIARPVAEVIGCGSPVSLADWNDRAGRTQEEVVAKLREAAALAREQGQ